MPMPHVLKRSTWKSESAELLQTLRDWPWYATLRTLGERFREDRLALIAGSLTFTTLIALVPLFTVMLALFSAFPMFHNFQVSLEKYFLQSLVPPSIARPVLGALTEFAAKASRLGGVGLVALVVTAIALMLTIDRTLNNIWRVRRPRPLAQRVLVYWAAVTLGPLALGVSLSMTSYAISASRGVVSAMPGGVTLLLGLLQFALFAAAMAGLFHYVPNTPVRWRHAWAGGLFVAVGFALAQRLLTLYVQAVPTYSSVYGAFATVPIFLVWLFCGWLVVLFGAVIAAYAPSLQMRVVRRADTPGHRFELALAVLRLLERARGDGRGGLDVATLAQRLRADPLQIEPVLETLMALDWVARLEEAGSPRHVLLCDPQAVPAEPLVARLLLAPTPAVARFWRRAALQEMRLQELLEA